MKLETEIQMRKEKLLEVAKVESKKREQEGQFCTLSSREKVGLKSIQERLKNEEIVVMESDKSGRFSIIKMEEYLAAGDKHVEADKELDEKELRAVQRKLNAACSMFVKVFKVGENTGQVDRHRGNVINHYVNPSAMKLTHKDHKMTGKVETRRLNGPGMNVNLSNFVAELLEPIADEMDDKAE